jgi:hypothetical protein
VSSAAAQRPAVSAIQGQKKHRPLDWASRSLQREFEEVIMVEVQIEEMFRSDRSRSKDYRRAVVVNAEVKEANRTSEECTKKCRQKQIDRADTVRDVW